MQTLKESNYSLVRKWAQRTSYTLAQCQVVYWSVLDNAWAHSGIHPVDSPDVVAVFLFGNLQWEKRQVVDEKVEETIQ